MATTVATADNRLRARLDTVATGSTWGAETMDHLSQAQRQLVADGTSEMFSDGALTGTNAVTIDATPTDKVTEIPRASDSLRVLYVTHLDGVGGGRRGARKLEHPDMIYHRASISNYASPAQGGAFYALSTNKIVVFPTIALDTVTENYLKVPTAFTASTDTYQIPDWMVDISIAYALYLALSQIGKGQEALAEYRNGVASLYKSFKLDPPPHFLARPDSKG